MGFEERLTHSWSYSDTLLGIFQRHPDLLLPEEVQDLKVVLREASRFADLNLATDYRQD